MNEVLFGGAPVLGMTDSGFSFNSSWLTGPLGALTNQPAVIFVSVSNPAHAQAMAAPMPVDAQYDCECGTAVAVPVGDAYAALPTDEQDQQQSKPHGAVTAVSSRSMLAVIPEGVAVGQVLVLAAPDGSVVRVSHATVTISAFLC